MTRNRFMYMKYWLNEVGNNILIFVYYYLIILIANNIEKLLFI